MSEQENKVWEIISKSDHFPKNPRVAMILELLCCDIDAFNRDLGSAVEFLEEMAKQQENVDIWYLLGEIFYRGHLVAYDRFHVSSVDYFKVAADCGHLEAQATLGHIYYCHNDSERATHYSKMAADRGHVSAQYYLGMLSWSADDLPEAIKYWEMAAAQGHKDAQFRLRLNA